MSIEKQFFVFMRRYGGKKITHTHTQITCHKRTNVFNFDFSLTVPRAFGIVKKREGDYSLTAKLSFQRCFPFVRSLAFECVRLLFVCCFFA